jgi:hypothetical protein
MSRSTGLGQEETAMAEHTALAKQLDLLHAYHLDLWVEIEAQLQTLRASQREIAELRKLRTPTDTREVALGLAELLADHARTLKGRSAALGTTVAELERTVERLIGMLQGDG